MSLTKEEERALVLMDRADVNVYVGFGLRIEPTQIRIEGTTEITRDTVRSLHRKQLIQISAGAHKGTRPGERYFTLSPGGRHIALFLKGIPVKLFGDVKAFYYPSTHKKCWCVYDTKNGSYAWGETPQGAVDKFNSYLFPKGVSNYDRPVMWEDIEVTGLRLGTLEKLRDVKPYTPQWFQTIVEGSDV